MSAGNRVEDIAPEVLARLNSGATEAATLTQCLAVDFAVLMHHAIPNIGGPAIERMRSEAATGISRRMVLAASLILDRLGASAIERLHSHPSDTVRGWACFMIGALDGLALPQRLSRIRSFADDRHFGVREWSWLAMRPHIAAYPEGAIACLAEWTGDSSERIRRFASEATRPRGVWCAHIGVLKLEPAKALPVLEPLKADQAAYVQASVGNWLNDAAKSQPDWVRHLCERWSRESPVPATSAISKRALRSIGGARSITRTNVR